MKHPNIVDLKEAFKQLLTNSYERIIFVYSKDRIHLVFEYCDKTVLELLEESPTGLQVSIKENQYFY